MGRGNIGGEGLGWGGGYRDNNGGCFRLVQPKSVLNQQRRIERVAALRVGRRLEIPGNSGGEISSQGILFCEVGTKRACVRFPKYLSQSLGLAVLR